MTTATYFNTKIPTEDWELLLVSVLLSIDHYKELEKKPGAHTLMKEYWNKRKESYENLYRKITGLEPS